MRRLGKRSLLLIVVLAATGALGQDRARVGLSGTFRPSGPPKAPQRTQVGSRCVVDLAQRYELAGSLVGEMEVDYRIFVDGDCTAAPGTYDERWISYGSYAVRVGGQDYTGALIYLATVKAGGSVDGTLTLGGGLSVTLEVKGHFEDGHLSYESMDAGSSP